MSDRIDSDGKAFAVACVLVLAAVAAGYVACWALFGGAA